jgi:hypothetical protein
MTVGTCVGTNKAACKMAGHIEAHSEACMSRPICAKCLILWVVCLYAEWPQELVAARSWRFKSSLPHQSELDLLSLLRGVALLG